MHENTVYGEQPSRWLMFLLHAGLLFLSWWWNIQDLCNISVNISDECQSRNILKEISYFIWLIILIK